MPRIIVMEEIWKDIPGYEGLYKISDSGIVESIRRYGCSGGIISPQRSRGYPSIKLCKNNIIIRHTIHKLVASAFLEKPDFYECINHIDGNKLNNHYSNLEYTTFKLNSQHAWRTGLCENVRHTISAFQTGRVGVLNGQTKAILQLDLNTGEVIKEHISATFAARDIKGSRQHISQCCTGARKSSNGYRWKHKNN